MSLIKRKDALDLEASRNSIQRALKTIGIKAYKARRKPPLSEENITSRLEFARKHKDWTPEDWGRIVFSDESTFRQRANSGRTFIWRTEEEIWEEGLYKAHIGQARGVMVWGAISMDGSWHLVRVDGTLDSEAYINILKHRLRRTFPGLYTNQLCFQQDNAPVHTSEMTMNWFNSKNIPVLEWPSVSPDLNIMENVWARVKHELMGTSFDGLDELWDEVQKTFKKVVSEEFLVNLYNSLPRRMAAVIKSGGQHTKY